METPSVVSVAKRLHNQALKLRNESERMLFLALFSALGAVSSVGVGYLFHHFVSITAAFLVGATLSSFILLPLFLLLGNSLWNALNRRRALSKDDFDVLKYMKDEFEREVREIQTLPLPETEKKRMIRERYESYKANCEVVKKGIELLRERRRGRYYLGD